jgi:inward rectifier potassium channel
LQLPKINFKKSEDRELGFGTSAGTNSRIMNRDGTSNVIRKGISHFSPINIYHDLITISWKKFFLFVLIGYITMNCLFALIYTFIGIENLTGVEHLNFTHDFWEAFFFSSQSFTTVGYGRVAPVSKLASSIAAFESLLGLLSLAVATGLLYGRFSRPTSALLYSTNCLVAPYKEIKALMFRVANARKNQLIEIEASVILAINTSVDGKVQRRFQNLELEIKRINFLSMSWTIVHPIDENSPLYNLTQQDYEDGNVEILILIKGIDDTYATTVYSRSSYTYKEIIWEAKFVPIINNNVNGKTEIDLSRISEYTLVS